MIITDCKFMFLWLNLIKFYLDEDLLVIRWAFGGHSGVRFYIAWLTRQITQLKCRNLLIIHEIRLCIKSIFMNHFIISFVALVLTFNLFGQQKPAIKILNHKAKIDIANLNNLNSTCRETNLCITTNGIYMFFMSDRGGMPWSNIRTGTFKGQKRFYDGDLWYSKKINDAWQDPICLDSSVNTYYGEDEPNISPDGQFVTYQSWKTNWRESSGPYYQSELDGDKWGNPRGLGGGINKYFKDEILKSGQFATDGATLSPDGKIFLVAAGVNYDGNMDIFISRKNSNGIWSYPEKTAFSTQGDDRSVFIAGDGMSIYFASNGYKGLGGLDIYKISLNDDGTYGEIINIGAPFNTAKDDYGFMLTASGKEAYFIRDGDIYYADISEADEQLKPAPTFVINGIVHDAQKKLAEASIRVVNLSNNQIILSAKSNSITGEYSVSFPALKGSYKLIMRGDYNSLFEKTIRIEEEKFTEIKVDPVLIPQPQYKPEKVVIDSFYILNFEFDSFRIEKFYLDKLDKYADILKSNPNWSLKIDGHTDSRGSASYNNQLGLKRAESVKTYFIINGIEEQRIVIKSYGKTKPASDNNTTEGSKANRRVEIRIVGSDL